MNKSFLKRGTVVNYKLSNIRDIIMILLFIAKLSI